MKNVIFYRHLPLIDSTISTHFSINTKTYASSSSSSGPTATFRNTVESGPSVCKNISTHQVLLLSPPPPSDKFPPPARTHSGAQPRFKALWRTFGSVHHLGELTTYNTGFYKSVLIK